MLFDYIAGMQVLRIAQAETCYTYFLLYNYDIVLYILLYHIAGMQALRIPQADLLREKQRSRDLA
jgi:hypothetical protein